ncbi:cytochrome oxidase assembly protein [Leptospira perolatii]|uniref:Cytochrome oxidase assembly protein n=1 Tax=Leptospira perolatii TaxID=2023191 RepID=A0A2M9ZRQ3_9LEPT|nr:COX15/CtaA family protein [Leptospira perolatii]PJZ71233.1 cytochrome oxidase assembly protein [Leptospira perolatii]PJZ74766.1 cytochrome oxidase assembly protein [Leptospira perolatii]
MEAPISNNLRRFAIFLKVYSAMIFFNLLYGPLVRATDSGLACPDWPLCFGKVFPDFDFNIFMEVSHRYYSMILGILLVGGTVWAAVSKDLRKPFLKYFVIAGLLISSQIYLGRLTVLLLLDPHSVNLHLLNAITFFLCILTANLKAKEFVNGSDQLSEGKFISTRNLIRIDQFVLVFGVALVFFQIVLGGRVSSHYAGLACSDFPTCNGEWFPSSEFEPKIGIQVQHRLGAYIVAIYLIGLNVYGLLKRFTERLRNLVKTAIVLLTVQFALGILNIFFQLPKLITAAHTGVAVLILTSLYSLWILRASELSKPESAV